MKKLTIAALISTAFLTACGGGGGSDPNPQPAEALRMTPKLEGVGIYAGYTYKIAQFTRGVKPYFVISNSSSVSGELDSENFLHLYGNHVGSESEEAIVAVQDSSLGQAQLPLKVQVFGLQLLSSAGNAASLLPGQVFETTIRGGAAPFQVVSSDASVANASIDASGVLRILAGNPADKPANADVTVVDAYGNQVTVAVTVTESVLALSPSSTVGLQGGRVSFEVFGGVGPYRVSSQNPLIAQPSISGTVVSVDLLTAGSTTILVTDSYGTSQTFSVEVRNPVVVMSPASQAIDESNNSVLRFGLSRGTAPYTAAVPRADQTLFSAAITEQERIVTPEVYDPVTGLITTPAVRETTYTLELGLGTQGTRCVSATREVEILVTDSAGNISRLPITVRNTGAC